VIQALFVVLCVEPWFAIRDWCDALGIELLRLVMRVTRRTP
jgi:prophage antirepressor-like protein